ncbi:MAG: pilus assembly protein TadG-related protein [Chloroflexota bacterium]
MRVLIDFIASLFRNYARHGEAGQQAVMLATSMPVILAMTGLLVDGSRLIVEYKRAQVAIDSAAFAAAQRIDRGQFFRDQIVVLDPGEAATIGSLYGSLNSRGTVRVTSIEVYGNVVVARGYAEIDPIFLKIFGAGQVHFDLVSQASPLYGILREGQ